MTAQDASCVGHNSVDTVCQLCSPAIKVDISHFNQISCVNWGFDEILVLQNGNIILASDLQVLFYLDIKALYPDKYCIHL